MSMIQEILNLSEAKKYSRKYLEMSWKLSNEKNEIYSYNLLRFIYYYEGENKKSQFYHNKMIQNNVEKNNSQFKRMSMEKYINKKQFMIRIK